MTRKESAQISQVMLDIYRGILFQNQQFAPGAEDEIVYDFDCPEFEELRQKYDLLKIAGRGSDFTRGKRLLHYLAPRLTHSSWYDNHIQCNALRLLEYSLNKPEQGINCLNKSKILVECCLAVGIYARRVSIMPFSPYDFDNHVVAEIYDRALGKWIMLDPTTDGYFIDGNKTPLSLLEMRGAFANAEFVTFVRANDSLKDIEKFPEKYRITNGYICKNLFRFQVEKYSTFGEKGEFLHFVPLHYSVKDTELANVKYRLDNLAPEHEEFREKFAKRAAEAAKKGEPPRTNVGTMARSPL